MTVHGLGDGFREDVRKVALEPGFNPRMICVKDVERCELRNGTYLADCVTKQEAGVKIRLHNKGGTAELFRPFYGSICHMKDVF